MAEHQLEDENDWVVVKKQKITILVPPASPIRSHVKGSRAKQLQTNSKKAHNRSWNRTKRFLDCSKPEERQTLGKSSLCERQWHQDNVQTLRTQQAIHPPGPDKIILTATSLKSGSCAIGESILRPCSLTNAADGTHCAGSNRGQLFSNLRFTKTVTDKQRLLVGSPAFVNQRIRASNLEKKLERLGGLRTYLASHGLDQFIQIFEREKINKFQLVNLTMHKLKDMGADAVGPRRKLLYAIDCLCQPYLKFS